MGSLIQIEIINGLITTPIKTKTEIEVKFPNKNFTFDLNLRYQTQEQINTIVLQLGLLTEAYPDILSIKYVDHENNLKDIIILDTNTRNYSLNDNRVKDNLYIFNITPVVTDQIIIQLASRENDSVLLKGIETYYSNILSNGYIILGPISTEDPILKLAVDSSTITEGIKIEVSTDKNYWIELNNSSSIGLNGTKKILSINTIGSNSIKNDQDIYSMYVKISIQSSVLSNENLDVSVYNTLREDSTIGNDLLNTIENIRLSAYRVSSSDYSYGNYIYNNTTNLATLPLDRIEYIQNNGIFKVLGLIDTKYSITGTNNTSNVLGSIGAELKLKRMIANSTLDADTYDVANCKLYDIYPREINEIVNIKQKDNLAIMLKKEKVVAEDIYTVIGKISKKSLQLDLTTPFILNSAAAIINVDFEDILIRNSIGEIVAEIKKENLSTIVEDNTTFYFLNLIDILFDPITVEGYTYSKLYPLKELEATEYGLLDGKIVTGNSTIVRIKGYELLKENIDIIRVVNYYNGNYIKRHDDNFTYYHEQFEATEGLKSVIKLENVSVEKGSLYLEEYLEDGEQYTSDTTSNTKFLNVNTKEDPKYIITDETNTDEYLQE